MLGTKLIEAAAGNAAPAGYQIERSLRFNYVSSMELRRTPSTNGNRKTWTWSAWLKPTLLFDSGHLFSVYASTSQIFYFRFLTTGQFDLLGRFGSTTSRNIISSQVFRDFSAWMHLIVAFDNTQSTATNRCRVYVNGEEIVDWATDQRSLFTQNYDTVVNSTSAHIIGAYTGATLHYSGYMAEHHFVDGQQLTPADFGEFDTVTGVWEPKAYEGTYGTNGYYLPFSDNSSASTLGTDFSGNGNDWTPLNFSVTAGSDNDSLVDTPTPYGTDTGVGGEVRGNYCTLNALTRNLGGGNGTPSDGDLQWLGTGGNDNIVGTMAVASGKWYFEVTCTGNNPAALVAGWSTTQELGNYTEAALFYYNSAGIRTGNKTSVWDVDVTTGLSFTNGDVVGFAIDIDASELKVYENGSLVSTLTLPTDKGDQWIPAFGDSSATDAGFIVNFGQRPFAYTAPSGFKALCTQNLPTPTVVDGSDYFNTLLWSGDGVSGRQLTGVGFAPDLVWIKSRGSADGHRLFDQVRGASKHLASNATAAETTNGPYGYLSAFDTDGFTLTQGSTSFVDVNASGYTYVGWNWNAGGSNATNTDGTITSTVRANPTAGFSIVSYTGNGTNPSTIGHGLGKIPAMVIAKSRSATGEWPTYHQSLTPDYTLYLNATYAANTYQNRYDYSAFTSSVFSTHATSGGELNTNGVTYIAYCFAEVEGFSKIGSYTGNGSTDGPFVYCGFRPAFVFIKGADTATGWWIEDTARDPYNVIGNLLVPSNSLAELTGSAYFIDMLSNGFKIRNNGTGSNANGSTYIFMAFATSPFKYSLAR